MVINSIYILLIENNIKTLKKKVIRHGLMALRFMWNGPLWLPIPLLYLGFNMNNAFLVKSSYVRS